MNQEFFGTTPPKKLFVKLAVPSLISMLFSSIYMLADGIFVVPSISGLISVIIAFILWKRYAEDELKSK